MYIVQRLLLLVFIILSGAIELLNIGSSCSHSNNIDNVQFNIKPWPIVLGSPTFCTLIGILNTDETIGIVQVGQEYKHTWTYNSFVVNAFYDKGQSFSFQYNFNSPTESGSYNQKILVQQNATSSNLLCWQFSYSI